MGLTHVRLRLLKKFFYTSILVTLFWCCLVSVITFRRAGVFRPLLYLLQSLSLSRLTVSTQPSVRFEIVWTRKYNDQIYLTKLCTSSYLCYKIWVFFYNMCLDFRTLVCWYSFWFTVHKRVLEIFKKLTCLRFLDYSKRVHKKVH